MINGKSQDPKNAVAIGTRKNEPLEIIYGHLLICGQANEKGEETSLTEEDITKILLSICEPKNKATNKHYQMINYHFEKEEK